MHRPSTPFRPLSVCGIVLTVVAASGCAAAEAAPEPSPESAGWAILSSEAEVETLSLNIQGGAETDGDVLVLDGFTGFGSATAPSQFDVTDSFTVAAWVSTTETSGPFSVVLSQIGDAAAGFYLGLAEGFPGFSMKDADTNEPGHTIRAMAESALASGEWVHLAGVFDAEQGAITLYVDGAPAAETPFDAPWQPSGVLTVGSSQAHGAPADFWAGAITEVRIAPAAWSQAEVDSIMKQSRPSGSPALASAADPSTYADGRLTGTWDSALTAEEVAFIESSFTPDELADIGGVSGLRLGFSGNRWWQGFVSESGETWLVNGVPEGDGGIFSTAGDSLTTTNGGGSVTSDWSLVDDRLTFVLTDCEAGGEECEDIDIVRMMFAREWIFRSSDPSY